MINPYYVIHSFFLYVFSISIYLLSFCSFFSQFCIFILFCRHHFSFSFCLFSTFLYVCFAFLPPLPHTFYLHTVTCTPLHFDLIFAFLHTFFFPTHIGRKVHTCTLPLQFTSIPPSHLRSAHLPPFPFLYTYLQEGLPTYFPAHTHCPFPPPLLRLHHQSYFLPTTTTYLLLQIFLPLPMIPAYIPLHFSPDSFSVSHRTTPMPSTLRITLYYCTHLSCPDHLFILLTYLITTLSHVLPPCLHTIPTHT